MSEKREIRASVRDIVAFVTRAGDIVPRTMDTTAFVEGGKAHRTIQSGRGDTYQAEVALETYVEGEYCVLRVSGRADGIDRGGEHVVIEEIKSTRIRLDSIGEDDFPAHWSQAMLYAHMIASRDDLMRVNIRLVYVHRRTGETREFVRTRTRETLRDYWDESIEAFLSWMDLISEYHLERNRSIESMEFPFDSFRAGQKEMAERVYRTILAKGVLYLEAPTGIGKTMGVLFPAVRSLAYGYAQKVFYLTAKTVARTVAEQAARTLIDGGTKLKSVTLTAKAKICFLRDEYPNQRPPCDPAVCQYARGHYTRIADALEDVFSESLITRGVVETYARKHRVCPFEFSLDITDWADIVIGDYNYAFDPTVQLQRFFQHGGTDYCLLVDEAHNLVDRGRDMFSAALSKRTIMSVKRAVKDQAPELAKRLEALNAVLLRIRKRLAEESEESGWAGETEAPKELDEPVRDYLREFENASRLHIHLPQRALDLYFDLYAFSRVLEWFGEQYLTLYSNTKRGLDVSLSCIDPSKQICETLDTCASTILFSATLEPMRYFMSLLTGNLEVDSVALDSPFPRHNLLLVVDPTISTRYRKRIDSYDPICRRLMAVVSARTGNYLMFFPSYAYAEQIRLRFTHLVGERSIRIVSQTSNMSEEAREEFLAQFTGEPDHTLVGFVVMGGIFAEGIDLQGDRLTGAVVVGPGLPQIGPERDVIKHYFDERSGHGFDYAYTYPGFNRVQQAAGRVIRTPDDRGVVLLIDDRFGQRNYQELFPPEWHNPVRLDDQSDLDSILTDFWG